VGDVLPFAALSQEPRATVVEAVKLWASIAVTWCVSALSGNRSRRVWFAITLGGIGAVQAAVGWVQRGLGATRIVGLFSPVGWQGFFGTFVNNNHTAAVLVLAGFSSAGLALASESRIRRFGWMVAAAAALGAVGWTGSRSGAVSLLAGGLAFVFVGYPWRRYPEMRRGVSTDSGRCLRYGSRPTRQNVGAYLLVPILAVFAVVATSVELDRVISEYAHRNQKLDMWRESIGLARTAPWVGVGRGAFVVAFGRVQSFSQGVTVTHPENLVLQWATEWGTPFAVALVVLSVVVGWQLASKVRESRDRLLLGLFAGTFAVVTGNLFDFSLELLGLSLPLAVALGTLLGAEPPLPAVRVPKWVALALGIGGCLLIAAAGRWAVPHSLARDRRALLGWLAVVDRAPESLRSSYKLVIHRATHAAIARHPADYYAQLLAASTTPPADVAHELEHLDRARRLRPSDPFVRSRLGKLWLRRGEKAAAARSFREAFERGLPVTPSLLAVLVAELPPPILWEALPTDPAVRKQAEALVEAKRGATTPR
jgi:hypothetical protein